MAIRWYWNMAPENGSQMGVPEVPVTSLYPTLGDP